jgi:N-acetyl-beta-hexosaminidase
MSRLCCWRHWTIFSDSQINMFHWHIVDSQSFPLEVTGFEELSQKGAYSANEIYSTSDVQDIVAYAGAVSKYNNRGTIR